MNAAIPAAVTRQDGYLDPWTHRATIPCYRCSDLLIDTGRRQVLRDGRAIALPRLTYRLLVCLLEAAPCVLDADALMDRVWDGRMTTPETIKQRVKLLRDALSDDASAPRYVEVVRGQGCRLIPPVQTLCTALPALIGHHSPRPAPDVYRRPGRRRT